MVDLLNYEFITLNIDNEELFNINEQEIKENATKYKNYDLYVFISQIFPSTLTESDRKIHKQYPLLIKDIELAFPFFNNKPLLIEELFLKFHSQNYNIKEVINELHCVNQQICHIYYFNQLIRNNELADRTFNEDNLTYFINNYNNKGFLDFLLNYKKNPEYDLTQTKLIYDNDYLVANEVRRQINIDNKRFFNYINIQCKSSEHRHSYPGYCPYSHNDYEVNFHPFTYKTKICPNITNCQKKNCFYAHNFRKDFRIIYNPDDSYIYNIIARCSEYCLFDADIKELKLKYDILPSEFNPKTYKTQECPFGEQCVLDKRLCLNYHNTNEKRRKLYEIELIDQKCKNVFQNNNWIQNICNQGDDCLYCHNVYEYYYHPKVFRKKECEYEKNEKKCEYILICPFLHKEDKYQGDTIYNKSVCNKYQNIPDITLEKVKSFKNSKNVKNYHRCYYCKEAIGYKYNILLSCKHYICENCDNKLSDDNCLVCGKKIESIKRITLRL